MGENMSYSLLRNTSRVELPVALGRRMANTKLGSTAWPMLHRLYNALDLAGKLACRGELAACRAAVRNPAEARVA